MKAGPLLQLTLAKVGHTDCVAALWWLEEAVTEVGCIIPGRMTCKGEGQRKLGIISEIVSVQIPIWRLYP